MMILGRLPYIVYFVEAGLHDYFLLKFNFMLKFHAHDATDSYGSTLGRSYNHLYYLYYRHCCHHRFCFVSIFWWLSSFNVRSNSSGTWKIGWNMLCNHTGCVVLTSFSQTSNRTCMSSQLLHYFSLSCSIMSWNVRRTLELAWKIFLNAPRGPKRT